MITLKKMKKSEKKEKKNDLKKGTVNLTKKSLKKEDWLEGVAKGSQPASHFDIPNPLERDEIFIDIVDYPSGTDC